METFEAIEKQMHEASDLLERLANLVPLPKGASVSGGQAMAKVRYDKATVNQLEMDISNWQYVTKTVVDTCFGSGKRHSIAFEKTIADYRIYMDAKEDLTKEVSDGRNILSSIIEAENLKAKLAVTQTNSSTSEVKTPLVFISHASSDATIIKEFVDKVLQLGLGLQPNNIAFTSEETFGVEPGENIAKYIKENITDASVVLIMISKNYKASEVCLNEMGAAWALGKKCISVVLPESDFEDLGWLTCLEKAIRITNKKQLASLCKTLSKHLKVDLNDRFTTATSKIEEFVAWTETIVKTSVKEKTEKTKTVAISSGPLKLFDAEFKSICLTEGEYIIQLDVRMRSEKVPVSIKHVFLRNEQSFFGSTFTPKKEMEFKSYILQGYFGLNSETQKALKFVKEDYSSLSRPILDTVIETGHTLSMSFFQYFETIRQCDCNEELQLNHWNLVVQYNIEDEVEIPLKLTPLDKDPRGMYWDR